ncbi:MAG: DUF111 family protein, partial [Bryobacteraceae bacterium]|nr:DUF111 family protein [Bryobacteraceae bacterium]
TMDRLFEAGALDVSFTPVHMKKNRPGTILTIVARPEDREQLTNIVFAETTTLGVRFYFAERRVMRREIIEVDTRYGRVRVKVADNGVMAPEYDDCRRLAIESGVPLRQIMTEAVSAGLAARQQ